MRQGTLPTAFWSYTRFDDIHNGLRLTELRRQLEGEVHAQMGRYVTIFQDTDDITWGEHWGTRLEDSLDQIFFLIPIITPSYLRSDACRKEFNRFLERETKLNSKDLILPIYYTEAQVLEDTDFMTADRIAQIVRQRNYEDWRERRFDPPDSSEMLRAIALLAKKLCDRIRQEERKRLGSAEIIIEIRSPQPNANVLHEITIEGAASQLPPGVNLWVVVEVGGPRFHPQRPIEIQEDGQWRATNCHIGAAARGSAQGARFRIHVVAVSADTDSAYQQYLSDARALQQWPGLPSLLEGRSLLVREVIRYDPA
jgi:hypothetical protein